MNTIEEKIITNYWSTKTKGLSFVSNERLELSICRLFIKNGRLAYFHKLTSENEIAEFTSLLTVFAALLQRYFETSNPIFSDGIGEKINAPLLFNFEAIEEKELKQYFQEVKMEVQDVCKYSAYRNRPGQQAFNNYCSFGISYNKGLSLGETSFPLSLAVDKKVDGLEMILSFSKAFVETDLATSFLESVKTWIVNLEKYIHLRVDTIPILSDEERGIVLNAFNDTAVDYSKEATIVSLFETQVAASPQNIAIEYERKALTYSSLNEQANQLANYLIQKRGIVAQDFVGVKLIRSEKLLIALLAVLKVGAVYVPIDVDYPAERIEFIEKDSNCKLLLDEQELELFVKNQNDHSAENIQIPIKSSDLAYIIYTSGTTGKPKGVMITHHNAAMLIQWAHREFNVDTFDVVYAATSYCFDLSVFEFFYTLSTGKKIRLLQNALEIGKYLKSDTNVLLNTVPSSMRNILEEKLDLKNVAVINLAGEPFPVDLALKLLLYNIEVRNLYGPSEDTTYSTCYKLLRGKAYRSIPVGKPISNSQAYILGAGLQPLPVGVQGKLYVAGAGVANGYLNRPELTTERFLENPFIQGGRMYDTGDMAKWMPDGNIVFLGRKDHQVKLRGYRIELEEIEITILKFSKNIRQTVVDLKQVGQEKVLVAFLVVDKLINKEQLKNYLSGKLPAYMIPNHYVDLDAIPLTPNGKINRNAFPDITAESLVRKEYVAPNNPLEEALAGIWQEMLGIDQVGVTDNFFELGGHSLMVGQVINKTYQELGKSLSIKDFFDAPTIKESILKLQEAIYIPIPAAPKSDHYPLTPIQRRLWVLSQLEGGSLAYNMPATVVLSGELDIPKFEKAFKDLIRRHEVLRTYFKADDAGEVHQHIVPVSTFEFGIDIKDFSGYTKEELDTYVKACNAVPFNLEEAPLLRATVFRLEDHKYLFLLSMHHIISDGWSMELLVSEVVHTYNQLVQGKTKTLPEPSIQYKDYSVWLADQLKKEKHKTSAKYWLAKFQGEIPLLYLPSFKKRPAVQTYNGKTLTRTLSKAFLAKLKAFSKANDATLFMALMAGVNALFYRYTHQNDIIIGTPVAGREHPDLERQIGLYLNTLAIRTPMEEADSFSDLLQKQKAILLSAYAHQTYPFDELIDLLGLKRDTSRAALFDVMVVLQNHTQLHTLNPGDGLSGITVEHYEIERDTAQFDLSFTFVENEALELSVEYNTDIYDEFLIDRMFVHFEGLANLAIDEPTTRIRSINYITDDEQKQLVNEFNKTPIVYPKGDTIIDIFERQVNKTPHNVAVVFEAKALTYQQLNERSNQLAHYLRECYKVQPDDLIGIHLDRSEQLLVAIFGILKSGAGYVPIDISYPNDRIEHIKIDSHCKVTIDEKELAFFDRVRQQYNEGNPQKINTAHDLAYVIYTSGTTGNPKGVMVEHRNVVSIYTDWKKEYCLDQFDISLLQLASVSFDVFVGDICRSLLNGGKMVVTSDDIKLNPEQLYALIEEHQVSIFEGTPGLVLPLLDYIIKNAKDYSFLRLVILGSDSFNNGEYVALKDAFGESLRIVNSYGVTEATIDSTYYDGYLTEFEGATPIGKPFSNTDIFILDSEKMFVPTGVFGEMHIGGAGVTRGYFEKAELTEQKFIKHPFKEENVYSSGDVARWLPDGNIEFLGRNDHQVKLRGYRIELGEIENTIAKFSAQLTRSLVVIKEVNREKSLVAYYSAESVVDKATLRDFLQQKLPEYMIPNFYVQLEVFPLTPNGKIDRKELPAFSGDDMIRNEYVAPRSKQEEDLVEIWETVLGVKKIGVTDNFFELGGHSLKITKLRSLINKTFNIDVTFNDLFLKTTIQVQGELVSKASTLTYEGIQKVAPQPDYVLSSVQRRIWVLSQFEGGHTAYNMPGVFLLKGKVSVEYLEKAFCAVIERHESLRTVFKQYDSGEIRQIVRSSGEINFSLLQEGNADLDLSENEIKQIVNSEAAYNFDLVNGPLIRAKLIKTGADTALLSVVMHHIIADGWSIEILTNELFVLYRAYIKNEKVQLGPLAVQYKDYAAWEQAQLVKESVNVHSAYWKNQFQGEIPILELPTNQKRPLHKTYAGKSVRKTIGKDLTQELKGLCKSNDSTLFMGLLAIVKVLLYRYTDQKDIVIGTPIAGRNHALLQNQIGAYINTLALRTQLDGEKDFESLLKKVKDTTLGAYEHQVYPFDKLVDDLSLRRDLSRHPLFDIMITLQNTDNIISEIQDIEGLSISEYRYSSDVISKFDIEFTFEEVQDELQLILIYNKSIFDSEFAERLFDHFATIIKGCINSPGTPISALPFLSASEESQLVHDFSNTAVEYPREKTFLHLFQDQVEQQPEAIALMDGEQQYSYAALDALSNEIAAYLTTYFPNDKHPIGILSERSSTVIAVLMGVMKSGRAYIPLDPTFPEERLKYIIGQSGLTILISESTLSDIGTNGIVTVTINEILNEISAFQGAIHEAPKGDDLAYVIYTSGSTGNPKGVEIEHRSLLNFLLSMKQTPGIKNTDCLFSVTTYAFDISILEFFAPLISGASVFVAKNDVLSDPEGIINVLEDIKPSIIQATPSFYQLLLNAGWRGDGQLKVLCGGDVLTEALAARLLGSCSQLWNMYGPTETTIWSTTKKIEHPSHANIIGKAIANTSLFVLSEFKKLLPKGAIGNLYIGGDGLAKGYYGSEHLTQQRFIKNPYGEGKIYETGDVVKWNDENELVFFGRNDNQVKIRGYRIELSEVETKMNLLSEIDQVVVIAKKDVSGNHILVAYFISEYDVTPTSLRAKLKDLLPGYMIPSYFIKQNAFPLTPNKKVDKRALANLRDTQIMTLLEYTPPKTEVEKKLVKLWQEVLGVERVGVKDNFFDLGGHSLNATVLVSKIQKEFAIKFSILNIFENPFVEDQSDLIENIQVVNYSAVQEDKEGELERFTI